MDTGFPPARSLCTIVTCGAMLRRAKRSEEHTSELQSQSNLVCRLLLEKKKRTAVPRLDGRFGGTAETAEPLHPGPLPFFLSAPRTGPCCIASFASASRANGCRGPACYV